MFESLKFKDLFGSIKYNKYILRKFNVKALCMFLFYLVYVFVLFIFFIIQSLWKRRREIMLYCIELSFYGLLLFFLI
jgi:hypothetical protein